MEHFAGHCVSNFNRSAPCLEWLETTEIECTIKVLTAACCRWLRERELRQSQWVWGEWAKVVIKKVRTVTDGPPLGPFHLNTLFLFRKSNINSTVRQRLTGTHLGHFLLLRMETSQVPGRRQWCHGSEHMRTGNTAELDLDLGTQDVVTEAAPSIIWGLWGFLFTSLCTFDPSPLLSGFFRPSLPSHSQLPCACDIGKPVPALILLICIALTFHLKSPLKTTNSFWSCFQFSKGKKVWVI